MNLQPQLQLQPQFQVLNVLPVGRHVITTLYVVSQARVLREAPGDYLYVLDVTAEHE